MNKLRGALAIITVLVATALMINSLSAQGRKFFPPFNIEDSCSAYWKDLAEVHLNVNRTMDDAIVAIDTQIDSKEYETSFGKYDEDRHFIVSKRMNLIREGTYQVQITVRCETPGQSKTCKKDMLKSGLAYTTKQRGENKGKYIVNLCPVYFHAPRAHVQKISPWNNLITMQGDIFLHELTHFGWTYHNISIQKAEDGEYDIAGVEQLAANWPNEAVDNADSYRIFMMKLAVRNRTIYR